MGDSSDPNSKVFSVRIVSLDYYMAPPIPALDISYSSFQGGKVNEVPVIRIYGSTPAGQKTCLHVHGALPYLYVPCSDISLQLDLEGNAFTNAVSLAIEKALKLKGNAGSRRQHVHGCSLVRAKKFYGYYSSEDLFLKICLYYPQDVSRTSSLLLAGAILDKTLQPHESHIPFLLQFLMDYNLYGMGHLHVSKLKFRHPLPDAYYSRKDKNTVSQVVITDHANSMNTCTPADLSGDSCLASPIWTSSTIPDGWTWASLSPTDSIVDHNLQLVKRQSRSELEGDALVEDILNQLFTSYTSLSQTHSEVKMVQSLIPILEDLERRGMQGLAFPPDPEKPLPQDVLRTLTHWLEMEKLLSTVGDVEGNSPFSQQSNRSLTSEGNPMVCGDSEDKDKGVLIRLEGINAPGSWLSGNSLNSQNEDIKRNSKEQCMKQSPLDQLQKSSSVGPEKMKAPDLDAFGLLKWLASSQAAEELNSDDELAHQTILSPFSSTIDEVLEKANADIENQSQQECQDILDSIADLVATEESSGNSISKECNLLSNTSVSGSAQAGSLDNFNDGLGKSSSEVNYESKSSKSTVDSFGLKRKKPEWGCLPISSNQGVINNSLPDTVDMICTSNAGVKFCGGTSNKKKDVDKSQYLSKDEASVVDAYKDESSRLAGCSVRDLMRKKRFYRIEHSDSKDPQVRYGLFKEGQKYETCPSLWQTSVMDNLEEYGKCTARKQSAKGNGKQSECSLPGKLPIISANAVADVSKDGQRCFSEQVCSDTCHGGITASLGRDTSRSSKSLGECRKDCLVTDAADSSPQSFTLIGTENFEDKASVYNSCSENCISVGVPKMHSHNLRDAGISDGVACTQPEMQFVIGQEEVSCLPEIGSSTMSAACLKAEPLNIIGLTLCKKPPVVAPMALEPPDVKAESEEISLHCGVHDDIIPFFPKENLGEKQLQNDSGIIELSSHSESVMGVPVHHQNDGSYLYMLTPVQSPPSEEHVNRWLSFIGRNTLSDSTSKTTALNISSELLGDMMESQGPLYPVNDLHLLDSSSNLNNQEKCDKVDSHNGEVRTIQKDDYKTSEFQSTVISPEISQLSGPDVKSKLTPVSQMGFRDPSSVSGGQQLTIMSIEIHAGCRGDLRPDPRFDAIDIITLVVQEDEDTTVDAFILMLSKDDRNGQNVDGLSNCKVLVFQEEREMFGHFVNMICVVDPDILMGWDIQSGSLGFLAERATYLGIGLLDNISRTPSMTTVASGSPSNSERSVLDNILVKANTSDSVNLKDAIIEDEWGRTHASGVHVSGRIVLNIWRLMRGEVKLNMYTLEAVADAVLRKKVPFIPHTVLTKWFSSGPGRARYRCMEYVLEKAKLNLHIMNQHDMINRTSELARVFGIDFFSVLSRGSQYRVESMLLRLAHTQNYVAISPGNLQVAHQPAMECLPLVMEPESGFYADPVVVLDFQSLYPSMIIAYNLCFCTCLGKITPAMENILGVSDYSPDLNVMRSLKHDLLLTPNGVMYVPSKVRRGVIPRLLEEILSTRIMVKQAMKKLTPSEKVLRRIYDARQLALKLIANVTYGYTAAGFSGRMPCAELADSIVQCGRRTLENAISFVNNHSKWNAKVIYGDTDSLFVLLKGRSAKEAFRTGNEIATEISALNPHPVVLKMEKVYHPCFLLTKKRYVGYSYESPDQINPKFDAKGIETVRRDSCAAVSKTMELSLRLFFEQQDINKVKAYLLRQWTRIISGRISLEDFVFAKEVRLGTYSARTSSLPPAAIVATKAMRADPRAEPRYGERVPYVVVHGEPGSRLVDMVVDPMELLAIDSPYRLNEVYYIKKQIIPALQRVFGLVGADLNQWFSDMPRPEREAAGKRHMFSSSHNRTRIDAYYLSKHCVLCGALVQGNTYMCLECSRNEAMAAIALTGRTAKLEKDIQHLAAICRHCGGGDWLIENGVKCTSLACSVFYERRKTQKEMKSLSAIATESGFYPKCVVEWF